MKWHRFLGVFLLGVSSLLAACGGGGQEPVVAQAAPAANLLGDLSRAEQSTATLDGRTLGEERKRALAVDPQAAPAVAITRTELFVWGQVLLPATFPAQGALDGVYDDQQGTIYNYRSYTTGFYLAVTDDDRVYVLTPDGILTAYGQLSDYLCQVKPVACGVAPTIAGTIKIEIKMEGDKSVVLHTVTPTLAAGKITGVSTGTIDPTQVTEICAESLVLGFDGNTRACGPYVDGKAVIGNVTNNDRVQYTLRTTTPGQYVWLGLDPSELTYWQCEGLDCRYAGPANPGFVEYSEGGVGYRKPRISVAAGKLILSFGRNQLAGFGLDGVPTSFTGEHFEFVFRSTTNPPTKAYHTWNETTKEFQVVFEGATLKCTDTGNVTVHRQVLGYPPDQVHYGDIAGWLSVATPPNPADLIWGFDPGVTPVVQPPLVGFSYQLPGC